MNKIAGTVTGVIHWISKRLLINEKRNRKTEIESETNQ